MKETYKDDFDKEVLRTQLGVLGANFEKCTDTITIFHIKDYLKSLSSGQLSLISQVQRLMQLLLVMPATNASSERSFSALRRVKNYLRATMSQERLMTLHVHKNKTDLLDTKV